MTAAEGAAASQDRPIGGNPFADFTLVLRSPYLLGIALFVVLLSTVNTLMYFEQLRLVQALADDFPDINCCGLGFSSFYSMNVHVKGGKK